jgi:hypothetical protein
VVKHRQLARQVGAFGEFAPESSTDLNIMNFPAGSTFVFGSWICEADSDGKLWSRLLKDSELEDCVINSTNTEDQLTEKLAQLSTSDPTRKTELIDYNSNSTIRPGLESYSASLSRLPGPFPLGLRDTASIKQEYDSDHRLVSAKKWKPYR